MTDLQMLSLHYSPCPNDTFIFGGISQGRVDTRGIEFDIHLADVEELNQRALAGTADVIKVSFHAYLSLAGEYALLDAGSALGQGVGPLVIAKETFPLHELRHKRIAIPGEHTTANLLLKLFAGTGLNTVPMVFSDVEDAVLSGEFDAGVIIHENRFTYKLRGLKKIADLGEQWEHHTGLPIPLGGIVARRSLGKDTLLVLEQMIRESIDWATANPALAMPYIRENAQEMDEKVMQEHIALYVTDYSQSLGERGNAAISTMFRLARERGLIA